ncbi:MULTISPECIES: restriction endonuclease subunit S [Corallococcus]|uniref:restriction endonuclease subunit S n=1 Tax=Corallococcus TaxID=83461 RepID=UPI0013153E78|nr:MULTISPECIES: restriction endonuclease subunit S [Corallococcus]
MSALPLGWATASLSELIAPDGVFSDGDWIESKDQDPNGAIRLIQLSDIGDGTFVDKSNRFVNSEKFEQLRCTEVFEGDVLIARMPTPLGRACLAPRLDQKCITVVDIAIVRPGPSSVKPKWLMHFLNAPSVREAIDLQAAGTTRRRISRGNLSRLELPVPPLSEQERIADKLDALRSRVDACRDRLDRIPAILKRFRQSILVAATSGDLTKEWRKARGLDNSCFEQQSPLGGVCTESFYGPRFGKSEYTSDGVPTIRTTDMTRDGRIEITSSTPRVRIPDDKLSQFIVQRGDLLVTRTGSIGVMAVFDDEYLAIPSAYLIRFRFSPVVRPRFVFFCLMAPYGQEQLGLSATAITQPNVNAEAIKRIAIPLPSLEEQDELIRQTERLLAFADRVEARLAAAQRAMDRIVPAMLEKAFRGELVPQGLNDESASDFLARLKSQAPTIAHVTLRRRPKTPGQRRTMSNTDKETLKARIVKLGTERFTFDELKTAIGGDYESLKAALFELLGEPTPVVRQVFDKKKKMIQLERVSP